MVFQVYEQVSRLMTPLAGLVLQYRLHKGKEDAARLSERRGHASLARPATPLVWIHAASVGETVSVLPLIKSIQEQGPTVLLTSGTVTSAEIAADRLPAGALHQYVPLDMPRYVNRFLDHWRPDLAMFAESEIWPVILRNLKRRAIPSMIINGRMSERSFARWQKMRSLSGSLFDQLSLCLAQTQKDANRYMTLGASPVLVSGNIKFDVPPPQCDQQKLAAMQAAIGKRPLWLAASTHTGEEEIMAFTHKEAARKVGNLLTMIVPRHPERGPAIRDGLAAQGFSVALRSAGQLPDEACQIYIADTLGELGLFFRLTPIVFMGGSLASNGGHNPIEPARLSSLILHGPHVYNFTDVFNALDRSGGGIEVDSANALAQAICHFFASPQDIRERADKARETIDGFAGGLRTTLDALGPHLTSLAFHARLTEAQ